MPKKGEDEDATGELRAVTDLMRNDEVLKIYEVRVENPLRGLVRSVPSMFKRLVIWREMQIRTNLTCLSCSWYM